MIYAATPERHLHRWPKHHLDLLRHDLMAAGREPDRFPVVFDVLWMGYDDPLATEEQLEKVLRWPWSDRFDTQSSFSVPQTARHDLPVARLLEMIEQGPPGP